LQPWLLCGSGSRTPVDSQSKPEIVFRSPSGKESILEAIQVTGPLQVGEMTTYLFLKIPCLSLDISGAKNAINLYTAFYSSFRKKYQGHLMHGWLTVSPTTMKWKEGSVSTEHSGTCIKSLLMTTVRFIYVP